MSCGTGIKLGILSAIFPIVLFACTNPSPNPNPNPNPNNNDANRYEITPDMTPTSSASLLLGHVETGFLGLGKTYIGILRVDGKYLKEDYRPPLLLTPGTHTILFRVFDDPVAAYVCTIFKYEKGKTYIVRFTQPHFEGTPLWLEDNTTGQVVSQKFEGKMFSESLFSGPLVTMMLAHQIPDCPAAAGSK